MSSMRWSLLTLVLLSCAVSCRKTGYEYQASDMCKPCHGRQVAQWRQSMHARAHVDSVYNRYFIKASAESKQKLETFCAGCHTPLGVRAKEIPFKKSGDTRVSAIAGEGVQCNFCHSITGYHRLENGGYQLPKVVKRVMRGPLKDAFSPMHGTEYLQLYRKAEYCGVCHNVSHPKNGIALESTFSEWRDSPYAKEGIVCQDCHMTAGLTRRIARRDRAGHGGPMRPHVSDHYFVGPNLLHVDDKTPQGRELRRRSLELMRRAARLTIGEPEHPTETPGQVVVPIKVSNVGAGHGLPTGVTEVRQMWLEIVVASKGKTLWRGGGLTKTGDLRAGTIVYHTEVFDAAGRKTTRFWATVRKGRDHRIPARGSITERVAVPVKDAQGEIKVKLRYRSVSPRGLAEVDAPRDLVRIPVITMAQASRNLKL